MTISKKLIISICCLLPFISYCQNITNGLVAFYPFNGNANDESVNSNNATVYGATLTDDRFGNPNSAYYFNGLTDYIEALDDSSLNPPQISIAAWISADYSASGTPDIVRKGSYSSEENHKYLLRLNSNSKPDFKIRNNGLCTAYSSWQSNSAAIDIQINKWQFLVGTFDGTSLKLYINGILYQTVSVTGGNINNSCSPGPLRIGYAWTTYPDFFKGKIDDVRIYNRALLDWEVDSLYGNPIFQNTIHGNIYTDGNSDCIMQSNENKLSNFIVKASPDNYYGWTDKNGQYQLKVDSGNFSYTLSQQYNPISAKLLTSQCATTQTVALTGAGKDTCCFNFANDVKQCTLLKIDIHNTGMRNCFKHNTFVNYCNYGFIDASNAQIKIEYPTYAIPVSSVPMWTSKSGSILIYSVGTIAAGFCGKISIIDSVICGNPSITGLTQCIKASISPVSDCVAEDPAWDKSSIKVTGSCLNDSSDFVILNEGSGDMSGSQEYRVYVNDTLIFTGNFTLKSGEQFIVKYPAQGQTVRLEADQHPLHPGKSRPRETIENCGIASPSPAPTGLVTTAPQDDSDEEIAITCNTIVNSYDPNDKSAIPSGIGSTKKVAPGEELEYTIRFQNTGTDVAYTVRIVDTIDVSLDVASFIQGFGSHPYSLKVSGKNQAVLTFIFNNINLPDSTSDKLGSNGLVSYRITIPSGTASGTIIKNKAYIYFDYNSPILTNETMHTVDASVVQALSKGSFVQVGQTSQVVTGISSGKYNRSVKVYPNPASGFINIEIPSYGDNMEMRLISVSGVVQKSVILNKSTINQVNLEGINAGMYLYEIWQDGERKAGGLLQIR
jgi:uncharacterized repeat protein (TIGR01451 family)